MNIDIGICCHRPMALELPRVKIMKGINEGEEM